jgi:hypothetical protein
VQLLAEFLFRLSFGLAVALVCTPARYVPAGFYRIHAYVLLGLNVGSLMAALGSGGAWWPAAGAAAASYAAAVAEHYERPRLGNLFLGLAAGLAILGAWLAQPAVPSGGVGAAAFTRLDAVSGGLLLGFTIAAMLLGHWYLNTPGMDLVPLRRLVALVAGAALLRAGVCGLGLFLQATGPGAPFSGWWMFVALRWLAGILGLLGVAALAWETLKIPNTQSATGILYVGVIGAFLGELAGQLLSAGGAFPV